MIQSNIKEVDKILRESLKVLLQHYDIKLMYIFGSYAQGKNNETSDLDIAVLLDNYNPLDKLNLIGNFIDIFKRNDIDLVILNSANSVLKHQVIKYGNLFYMENEDIKVEFEVKVLKEYMDMEHFRKTQAKYIHEWVENAVRGD